MTYQIAPLWVGNLVSPLRPLTMQAFSDAFFPFFRTQLSAADDKISSFHRVLRCRSATAKPIANSSQRPRYCEGAKIPLWKYTLHYYYYTQFPMLDSSRHVPAQMSHG